MATKQTIGVPTLRVSQFVPDPQVRRALEEMAQETTRWLQRLAEGIDESTGLRGTPVYHTDVNANGKLLTDLGIPKKDTDAQIKGLALGRDTLSAKFWDAKGLPIKNLPKELSQQDATAAMSQEQIRELIKETIRDALDLAITKGTFTVTGTGFAVNPTGTARWIKIDDFVLLFIPTLTGTSNATTFTLTGLPATLTPTQTSNHVVVITDGQNTSTDAYGLLRFTASSTTITMVSPIYSDESFTASGTKSVHATFVAFHIA